MHPLSTPLHLYTISIDTSHTWPLGSHFLYCSTMALGPTRCATSQPQTSRNSVARVAAPNKRGDAVHTSSSAVTTCGASSKSIPPVTTSSASDARTGPLFSLRARNGSHWEPQLEAIHTDEDQERKAPRLQEDKRPRVSPVPGTSAY